MEALTVTDIMVGDIIRYVDQESPQKATIDTLRAIKEGTKVMGVELTAEILQKIGFSMKEGGYLMTLAIENTFTINIDDEYGQHKWSIIITDGPWNIKIQVFGMLAISIVIHFVHELQHALRLVGLNELADSIKV